MYCETSHNLYKREQKMIYYNYAYNDRVKPNNVRYALCIYQFYVLGGNGWA